MCVSYFVTDGPSRSVHRGGSAKIASVLNKSVIIRPSAIKNESR